MANRERDELNRDLYYLQIWIDDANAAIARVERKEGVGIPFLAPIQRRDHWAMKLLTTLTNSKEVSDWHRAIKEYDARKEIEITSRRIKIADWQKQLDQRRRLQETIEESARREAMKWQDCVERNRSR